MRPSDTTAVVCFRNICGDVCPTFVQCWSNVLAGLGSSTQQDHSSCFFRFGSTQTSWRMSKCWSGSETLSRICLGYLRLHVQAWFTWAKTEPRLAPKYWAKHRLIRGNACHMDVKVLCFHPDDRVQFIPKGGLLPSNSVVRRNQEIQLKDGDQACEIHLKCLHIILTSHF